MDYGLLLWEDLAKLGVDPTHSACRITASLHFRSIVLHITYFHRHSLGGAPAVHLAEVCALILVPLILVYRVAVIY